VAISPTGPAKIFGNETGAFKAQSSMEIDPPAKTRSLVKKKTKQKSESTNVLRKAPVAQVEKPQAMEVSSEGGPQKLTKKMRAKQSRRDMKEGQKKAKQERLKF